jgi:uncharacterized membrane protein YedE/YeeE
MKLVLGYIVGLVFGLGIALSGMINPAKVLNFFDPAGTWDPSLAFVMGSALAVAAIGYRIVFRRSRPLLDDHFHLPKASAIDARLVGGAAIFGIGWGIAGFCPGGALPALGSLRVEPVVFVAALLAGILITRAVLDRANPTPAAPRRA